MMLNGEEMASYEVKIPVGDVSVSIETAALVGLLLDRFDESLADIMSNAIKQYVRTSTIFDSEANSLTTNSFDEAERAARDRRKE